MIGFSNSLVYVFLYKYIPDMRRTVKKSKPIVNYNEVDISKIRS